MVMRLALRIRRWHFDLISGSRKTLDLRACEADERLLAAWPDHFREQRLPIDLRDAEICIKRSHRLPESQNPTANISSSTSTAAAIRDRSFQHAIKEAYRGLMEPGRQRRQS